MANATGSTMTTNRLWYGFPLEVESPTTTRRMIPKPATVVMIEPSSVIQFAQSRGRKDEMRTGPLLSQDRRWTRAAGRAPRWARFPSP
jgi:hypothetical protein